MKSNIGMQVLPHFGTLTNCTMGLNTDKKGHVECPFLMSNLS